MWVVKRKGKRDLLLPYIPPVVLNVDLQAKRVDVEIWKVWTIRMKVDILTIFPNMFDSLNQSIVGKAQEKGLLELHTHDFRENASNKQRHVDDMPYGGGQGMLLMPQPIYDTMDKIPHEKARVILLDPAGKRYNQKWLKSLPKKSI